MSGAEPDASGDGRLAPEPVIDCIDCGGRAHLVTPAREDGAWLPGDLVTYRCEDCLDRWDLILPGDDAADPYDDWG